MKGFFLFRLGIGISVIGCQANYRWDRCFSLLSVAYGILLYLLRIPVRDLTLLLFYTLFVSTLFIKILNYPLYIVKNWLRNLKTRFLNWLDFLRFYTRFPRDSTHDENGINHVKKNKLLSFSQRKMLFMNIVDNEKNFLSSSFLCLLFLLDDEKKVKAIWCWPICPLAHRSNTGLFHL